MMHDSADPMPAGHLPLNRNHLTSTEPKDISVRLSREMPFGFGGHTWRSDVKRLVSILAVAVILFATMAYAEDDRQKELERLNNASKVLDEIMSAPDKGIPAEILTGAECVAVVPSMIKGGFVFGARYGKGVATCRTAKGWSAPAPMRIEGGSWGLQIGGEAVDLVMLVMNQKGMNQLLDSKFKIGADVSGAAGPVGRHAEGTTDWKLRAQVLTYSRARGAFAGLELNGAAIRQDEDDTRALYGRMIPFRQILSGRVPPPEGTQSFIADVGRYFREAKSGELANKSATTGGTSGTASESQTETAREGATGAAAASTGSAASASENASAGTSGSAMSTSAVQNNIQKALSNAPGVNTSGVTVNVTQNAVELSGTVPSEDDRQTIIRIAEENADGRNVVDKNLKVK